MSTPSAALGVPDAVRPGQLATHWPVHAVVVPWSFSNRYSVWPFGPTRNFPSSELLERPTVWPPPAAGAAGAGAAEVGVGAAAVGAVFFDELPHAPSAMVTARA